MTDAAIFRRVQTPVSAASSLAPPRTFAEGFSIPLRSAGAVVEGLHEKKTSANALGPLQQSIAMGGGLILATLATLSEPKKSLGMGHALAASAWLLALFGGAQLCNELARLKTGLNLNQQYFDSNGERRAIMANPQSIPYQLIPDEQFHWVGDRMGIPYTQQRRRLIEEKIQQTGVQSQTWWLLSAGLGIPVFTMAIRDGFQDAVQGLAGKLVAGYHRTRALQFREAPVLAERSLMAYLDQQLGEHKFSWLSRWRKRFDEQLIANLGLRQSLGLKAGLRLNDAELGDAILTRLHHYRRHPEDRLHLLEMNHFLNGQIEQLSEMGRLVVNLRALKPLPPELVQTATTRLQREQQHALGMVRRYQLLFQGILNGTMNPEELTRQFREIGSARWLAQVAQGEEAALHQVRVPDAFREALKSSARAASPEARICELSRHIGPLPRAHLVTITRKVFDKWLWKQRVFGLLGGALTVATAIYYAAFVGNTQPRSGGRS